VTLNATLKKRQDAILKPESEDAVVVHDTHINALCFDKRGQKMFTADGAGRLNVWRISGDVRDPASYICLRQIARDLIGNSIFCMQIHPIRGNLLVLAQNSILRMYDSHTPYESIAQFVGINSSAVPIKCCFSPDGRYVLAGSDDGHACMWKTPKVINPLELATATPISETESACWNLTFRGPVGAVDWSRTEHLLAVGAFGPHNPIVVFTGKRPLNPEDLTEVLRIEEEEDRRQAEVENSLMTAALEYANKEKLDKEEREAALNQKKRKPSVKFADESPSTPQKERPPGADDTADPGALIPKPSLTEHDRTIIKRMQNLAESMTATVDMTQGRGGMSASGIKLSDSRPLNERVADVIARLKSGRRLFKSRDDPDTSDEESPTSAARAGVGTSLAGRRNSMAGVPEFRGANGAASRLNHHNSMEGVEPFRGSVGSAGFQGHGRLDSMAGVPQYDSNPSMGRPPLQRTKLKTEDGPTLEEKVNTRRKSRVQKAPQNN